MLTVVDWHYVPVVVFVLALVIAFWLRSSLAHRFHSALVDHGHGPPSHDREWLLGNLSPRETEIARLVAQGQRNHDIAHILGIGEHTVETHLTHIYQKLGISNRVELTLVVSDLLDHL